MAFANSGTHSSANSQTTGCPKKSGTFNILVIYSIQNDKRICKECITNFLMVPLFLGHPVYIHVNYRGNH